ncbi:hypothetical protein [Buchananella hordeovulneris]|uniref:50S ribosomal protein L7/L12 n=1 Tax=Buchananella hordeovulneris TaxID=52770 RepID=A0A1Q5PV99_9ACTO|nr:hypothetical protein [Buchananella hordeovulneris]MDO5080459.1 50S ribosomal protein L7/L12 [Buchananella hordeovulneris]OKL51426.1 50S ribosomal protein L7/L12 [Buchananella hordeovulneris]RRD44314.1 50S ribosomal protein L7/L12 [Buchananella hordeovulneris]RRD51777.1 50S ribosomal protein L7/L12 [Buchananella hordeovulneris]
MGKWFAQAQEIERLRREKQRLLKLVKQLQERLGEAGSVDTFGVSAEERQLAASGRKIEAIRAYRVRTGADVFTAKEAIDSVA